MVGVGSPVGVHVCVFLPGREPASCICTACEDVLSPGRLWAAAPGVTHSGPGLRSHLPRPAGARGGRAGYALVLAPSLVPSVSVLRPQAPHCSPRTHTHPPTQPHHTLPPPPPHPDPNGAAQAWSAPGPTRGPDVSARGRPLVLTLVLLVTGPWSLLRQALFSNSLSPPSSWT